MDTTSQTVWSPSDDLLAYPPASTHLEVDDHDTGERSETLLSVRYQRLFTGALDRFECQTVQYECAHGRVRLYIETSTENAYPDLGPRIAIAHHAWGFTCSCYRDDW